nr:hypothetical protein [uncultured Flavobacterium sp.]
MANAQKQKKFYNINFNKYFYQFLIDPAFFMQEIPNYDPSKKQHLIITRELIQKYGFNIPEYDLHSHWELTEIFLKSVIQDYSDRHPVNNNIFLAQYKQGELVFFGRPVICKVDRAPKLIFGTETKGTDNKFTIVNLEVKNGVYSLNGCVCEETFVEYPDLKSPDPNKKVKVPEVQLKVTIDNNVFLYYLNIKLDNVSYDLFKEIWSTKDVWELNGYLKPLFSERANLSTIFSEMFASRSFPEDGIVLKIVDVVYYSDNVQYPYYYCVLDNSNLPPIMVTPHFNKEMKEDPDFEPYMVGLNEVGALNISDSHDAGKLIKLFWQRSDYCTPNTPYYLHITGINKKNKPTFVPEHTLYSSKFVPDAIKRVIEAGKNEVYYLQGDSSSIEDLDLIGNILDNPL